METEKEEEMRKPPIDFKELRDGEKVICPECKEGIIKTDCDPKTAHHFKCDKCGLSINFS